MSLNISLEKIELEIKKIEKELKSDSPKKYIEQIISSYEDNIRNKNKKYEKKYNGLKAMFYYLSKNDTQKIYDSLNTIQKKTFLTSLYNEGEVFINYLELLVLFYNNRRIISEKSEISKILLVKEILSFVPSDKLRTVLPEITKKNRKFSILIKQKPTTNEIIKIPNEKEGEQLIILKNRIMPLKQTHTTFVIEKFNEYLGNKDKIDKSNTNAFFNLFLNYYLLLDEENKSKLILNLLQEEDNFTNFIDYIGNYEYNKYKEEYMRISLSEVQITILNFLKSNNFFNRIYFNSFQKIISNLKILEDSEELKIIQKENKKIFEEIKIIQKENN